MRYVSGVTSVRIGRDDAGQRVDRFLRKALPGSSLGNVFRMLRKGLVRVDGRRVEGDHRLAEGAVVEVRVAGATLDRRPCVAAPPRAAAAHRDLTVLFRDEDVLAVDKPAELLVQPGEGGDGPTLQDLVLAKVGRRDARTFAPAPAHRLDRGTSGVVLFGLSARGLRGLTEAFRARRVEKRYLALVAGSPPEDRFTVDLPLAKDPSDATRGARVKVSRGEDARSAVTDFTVLARDEDRGFALVEARPRTGRTHQIRAHLRSAKFPIVGDPKYGDPRRDAAWRKATGLRRQFLHAWRVRLAHPADAARTIEVESPLPPDLRRALSRAFGGRPPELAPPRSAREDPPPC